jgi:type III pantothenate kinase
MSKKASTYLSIDQGNTALKFAVFQNRKMIYNGIGVQPLKDYQAQHAIDKAILSSVGDSEIVESLQALFPNLHVLSSDSKLPITNDYLSPKTLGQDRLANAVAGNFLAKKNPALIIDIGTCLKFDFVDSDSAYKGGAIAPGLRMRYKALEHFTAALPDLSDSQEFTPFFEAFVGQNTQESIHVGVYTGMCNEINETIRRYVERYTELTIFLTGGDAHYFENVINYRIFAASNLTLLGLSLILEINE